MERERMLSVRQAAQELNVTPMTVLRHIAARDLPATDVDGRYIIFQSDLETFRQNHRGPGWPKGKPRGPRKRR